LEWYKVITENRKAILEWRIAKVEVRDHSAERYKIITENRIAILEGRIARAEVRLAAAKERAAEAEASIIVARKNAKQAHNEVRDEARKMWVAEIILKSEMTGEVASVCANYPFACDW
jgi:hypothetical protein